MSSKPRLSIIVTSYNAEKTIERCLGSLRNQDMDETYEVIVIDSSTDSTAQLVEKRFPWARLYRFQDRKFCGDARNVGISVAKGDIIAFMDADCTADRGWVREILKAHQCPHPAIGGCIANGNPSSYVGWAAYFCELSQWMPGGQPRWMTDIGGGMMSYKRGLFKEQGLFMEGTYSSDTEFHWRIGRQGYGLWFVPSIIIYHHNIESLKTFLIHEFLHGRSFARVRAVGQRFSHKRRMIYAIFSFLIPLRLLLKKIEHNMRNRVYLPHFIKSLPLLIIGLVLWSLGECAGYVKPK